MFKENRLIFEFEQPKESGSNLPSQESDKAHKGPESPFGFLAKAFGSLEDLEKLAEKQTKINAVFDKFKPFLEKENGLLHFIDLQKTTKLNKQQIDALFKAFEEEALKALIAEQIEAGYEFVKFNNDGLSWTWKDPVGNLITRINPLFKSKDIYPVLNNEITDQLKKLHEELINKDIETILQNLVSNGSVAKTLTMGNFKKTDFARDIREALRIVHSLPAGHGYILDITKKGEVNFLLEDESLKEKAYGYKDLSYNLKDYDQYLNQPTEPIETKEEEKTVETAETYVAEDAKQGAEAEAQFKIMDISKNLPEQQTLNSLKIPDEMSPDELDDFMQKTNPLLDSLAQQNETLDKINKDAKKYIADSEQLMAEYKAMGKTPKEIRDLMSYSNFQQVGKTIMDVYQSTDYSPEEKALVYTYQNVLEQQALAMTITYTGSKNLTE